MISQGKIRSRIFTLLLSAAALGAAMASAATAHAQNAGGSSLAVSASSNSVAVLPDDPSVAISYTAYDPGTPAITRQQVRQERTASLHMKYIPPGWKVLPLAPHDKVLLGFKDLYNPYTIGTIVISAGYSHLTNGQPNYGTNGGAFAQRFGAAFLRDSTQGLFTDAVFAPLLHEDPRYYVEGSDYSFVHRSLYAITRPVITRSDSGRPRLNAALLLGYAGSSALTYAYYPSINRNMKDTVATFGGGVGGAALGFFVTEFTSGIMQKIHPAAK
jgi:hypothetical protein